MFLSKLELNLTCREVVRDITLPYEMHSTLCRAFSNPNEKCESGTFLWRMDLKPKFQRDPAVVLVQSKIQPNWENIKIKNYFLTAPRVKDLSLFVSKLITSKVFNFRLQANPSSKVNSTGNRKGIFTEDGQIEWIKKKGQACGFVVKEASLQISNRKMLKNTKRSGVTVSHFSVVFDGQLQISDINLFLKALTQGIGHGKIFGLGLLSIG